MKSLIIPILALAAIVGAGCTHTNQGGLTGENTPENTQKFVLLDAGTQHSISANTLQEARLPDGRLDVAANVRNLESRRIQVQVNCEFKDAQGLTLDSTPWQTLILTENGQETVRFASVNNQASRYTIRIRQAH